MNGESTSTVWPTLGSRTAIEQKQNIRYGPFQPADSESSIKCVCRPHGYSASLASVSIATACLNRSAKLCIANRHCSAVNQSTASLAPVQSASTFCLRRPGTFLAEKNIVRLLSHQGKLRGLMEFSQYFCLWLSNRESARRTDSCASNYRILYGRYAANVYTYYYQYSITRALFHSSIKTFLFCKSIP